MHCKVSKHSCNEADTCVFPLPIVHEFVLVTWVSVVSGFGVTWCYLGFAT